MCKLLLNLGNNIAGRRRGREESTRFLLCWNERSELKTEGFEGESETSDAGYVATLIKHVAGVAALI